MAPRLFARHIILTNISVAETRTEAHERAVLRRDVSHEALLNMRLFADRVMPALQHDAAFAQPAAPAPSGASPAGQRSDGIFAPA
jgi:hypothetical protein